MSKSGLGLTESLPAVDLVEAIFVDSLSGALGAGCKQRVLVAPSAGLVLLGVVCESSLRFETSSSWIVMWRCR